MPNNKKFRKYLEKIIKDTQYLNIKRYIIFIDEKTQCCKETTALLK